MITLATLAQATAQEVFDQVVNHLRKQGTRSILEDVAGDICAYRGENGTMCAAGCLIGDSEYFIDLEKQSWGRLIEFSRVPSAHGKLITELQLIHDTSSSPFNKETLEIKLQNLAERYNLDFHC